MIAGVLLALAVLCWPSRAALRRAAAAAGLSARTGPARVARVAGVGSSATSGGSTAGGSTPGGRTGPRGGGLTPTGVSPGGRLWDRLPWRESALAHRLEAIVRGLRGGRHGPVLPLLDAAAAALRAGLPTVEALDVAGGAVPESQRARIVAPVVQAAREGRSVAPAWQKVARQTGAPDLAAVGRAWALSERTGAPLAEALGTAATVARARLAHRRRVDAATAGAHATSALLTLLPLGGVGVGLVLGLSPTVLYGTPVAQASLGVGLVTLLLGRVVVRRMVARVAESRS